MEKDPQDRPRNGRSQSAARPLGDLASRVLEPVIARRAGMTIDLVAAWDDLVGERHASYSRPERIVWPRRAHEDDPFKPGTLIVACDGARAIWLQHEAGEIVERLNVFFGFPALARIRIVQKQVVHLEQRPPRQEPKLDPQGARQLERLLSGIEPGPLRDRLARLGAGVLFREKRRQQRR